MDDALKFNDILKKSFVKLNMFNNISVLDVTIGLILSCILGLFIFYIYKKSFRGVVYSHSFNVTLVLMVMITSLIIMTISTNIVLSLGMVGALSIVRFRTALKDPLDIVFMFWAIATGIAVGAGVYPVAIIGALAIGLTVYGLARYKFKGSAFLLIIHYMDDANDAVRYQINKLNHVLKSKNVRKDHTELVIEMKIIGDNTGFVNEISLIEGVNDVSLVSYNGDYAP